MSTPGHPINPPELVANSSSAYPEPFRARVLPRRRWAIGDAAGLTRIGVNLTTLGPGAMSSMRHWHTHEDELVYLLSGELTLITDAGEVTFRAGQCVGFPAGLPNGHCLVNRSRAPAEYLEISNRDPADSVAYPDEDLRWNAPDARGVYSHLGGRPY